jgi:hypothetical protein
MSHWMVVARVRDVSLGYDVSEAEEILGSEVTKLARSQCRRSPRLKSIFCCCC